MCLFDDDSRFEVRESDTFIRHCYLPHVQPGRRHGYRVHDGYAPSAGKRVNSNKLLRDPHAKATSVTIGCDPALCSCTLDGPDSRNVEDSTPHMTLGVAVSPCFDWIGDGPLRTPDRHLLTDEAPVKGLARLRHTSSVAPSLTVLARSQAPSKFGPGPGVIR